jgi:hypothetical protein
MAVNQLEAPAPVANRSTVLSDAVMRRLIGVGQVDIVVGVPTLNHAASIAGTLDAVDEGLLRHFPRARTVVIGADGGSNDGTVEAFGAATPAAARSPGGGLRTRHRVAAAARGLPGRAGAIRLILTAADLLQAQAVVICDADANLGPDWLGAVVQSIVAGTLDVVAAAPARHPLAAPLMTQLVRPLMRGVYGRQLDHPMLSTFACSRRFAAGCLADHVWDREPTRESIGVWLAAAALAGDYAVGQARLGPPAPRRQGHSLAEIFTPVVGALFTAIDAHAGRWLALDGPAPVPTIGAGADVDAAEPPDSSADLGASFAQDVRDLRPVLRQILAAGTLASLEAIAAAGVGTARYDDDTWAATVYDFAAAHHHAVIDRAHIAQALTPLYLGRAASFLGELAGVPVTEIDQRLDALSLQFELRRDYLIGRWRETK